MSKKFKKDKETEQPKPEAKIITPQAQSAPVNVNTAKATKQATSFPDILSSKYLEYGLLLLLALIYFFIRQNFWAAPMERDEGIYAYFGHLVLEGKVPYIDFYEHRLPGIFYMYAILVGIFGDFEGLACGITLLNIGTLLFIYFFSRNWFNHRPTAFIIAITSAILGLAPEISGFTRQSEHIVAFWLAGGLYFLLQAFQKNSWKYLLSAGVFMCLSMLTKPNGVFFIILGGLWVVAYYFFDKGEKWGFANAALASTETNESEENALTMPARIKRVAIKAGIYSAAVFGTFGVLCLIMAAQGALGEMFYWSVEFSAGYVSRISMGDGFSQFFVPTFKNVTANYSLFWGGALLGLVINMFVREQAASTFKKIALWAFVLCSFMTITPAYTFYGHYWIMFVPSIAFAFGAAIYSIYSFSGRNMIGAGATLAIFAILLFVHSNSIGADKSLGGTYYSKPKIDKIIMKTYGGNPFNEAFQISKYIKPRLAPTDQIALIGSEPELYIYTGARAVTRHAYFSYLMMDSAHVKTKPWQEEYRNDIETKKPKIIVFFNHDISILPDKAASFTMVNNLLTQYIPQHYRVIGVVDLVGTGQPRYVLDENTAPTYQFAKAQNGGRIWTILIYQRNDETAPMPAPTPPPTQ
jgi:hypothetical protein